MSKLELTQKETEYFFQGYDGNLHFFLFGDINEQSVTPWKLNICHGNLSGFLHKCHI